MSDQLGLFDKPSFLADVALRVSLPQEARFGLVARVNDAGPAIRLRDARAFHAVNGTQHPAVEALSYSITFRNFADVGERTAAPAA